jgi:Contractile injection system tube protein
MDPGKGDKKRLVISRCTVDGGIISVQRGDANQFEAMLNPTDYSHDRAIDYDKTKTMGQLGSDQKFCAIKPETLSFKLLLDGTGAIKYPGAGSTPPSVKELLKKLHDTTYDYKGDQHEPSVVQVLWGELIFHGRLTSQKVENTLFKPEGGSLRASVFLVFESFISNEEEAKQANKSSPDLSHGVIFRQGDTLPLLCYKIYRDASYYAKVARANNIINFRQIKSGTRIWFPPLR